MRAVRTTEWLLVSAGSVLLLWYLWARLDQTMGSRAAIRAMQRVNHASPTRLGEPASRLSIQQPSDVDFSLWSEKRVFDYHLSLTKSFAEPLAILTIPKIHVEVAVFNGTDDLVLNRGVGRIIGTAKPGETGNIGIAGHRDGFFRGLKDVTEGDVVVLTTPADEWTYAVERIQIVSPEDVSVLADRGEPYLTLVTCYPFYFIGDAPKRRIFHCSLKARAGQAAALQSFR